MRYVKVKNEALAGAAWYFQKDPEAERYYNLFFAFCRKFNVNWSSANEKERYFIEEVTRVTYKRDKAQRLGLPLSKVRPAFDP